MDFKKMFESKVFKGVLIGAGALVAVLVIFGAGMAIGFKKADFSFRWGENYHKNFGGPRGGFFRDFTGRDFIDAHGVFGQIIKIDPSTGSGQAATIIIKGRENVERTVVINDGTIINRGRETIKIGDLKINDYVVIVGEPNSSGQIEAKLIRNMPPPLSAGPRDIFPNKK